MKYFIASLFTLVFIVVMTIQIVKSIQFNQNCGGYLERAANANTIEIAQGELSRAIKYIEENNLTSGYTSVIYKTPDEDLGFWYNNVKTSYNELLSLPEDASPLEKSNMLIKLRETLIDHGDKGDKITVPDGISRYPNNATYMFFGWISFIGCVICWFYISLDL